MKKRAHSDKSSDVKQASISAKMYTGRWKTNIREEKKTSAAFCSLQSSSLTTSAGAQQKVNREKKIAVKGWRRRR